MARASTAAANDTGDVDELFAVPPEKFVAARDAAVAALKERGDKKAAAELKAIKRPTPSAWLVNALVRGAPKEVEAAFEAGDALMKAQGRVLAGASPAEMQTAMKHVRDAIGRAMKRARAIAADNERKLTTDLTRRVTHTLRSAALDPRLRELVLAGRLTTDPAVDEVEPLAEVKVPKRIEKPAAPAAGSAKRPKGPTAAEKRAAEREKARAELEAKKAAEREARERLKAEVAEAKEAADEAHRALANAEAEERRARAAADEAEREVKRLRHAYEKAAERHERAKKRLL
jgi:hypothetical protein